jgi:hypothetical protein
LTNLVSTLGIQEFVETVSSPNAQMVIALGADLLIALEV